MTLRVQVAYRWKYEIKIESIQRSKVVSTKDSNRFLTSDVDVLIIITLLNLDYHLEIILKNWLYY